MSHWFIKFGLDPELVDRQLRTLSKVPPSFLLRFPEAQIADEILRSLEFTAADFRDPKSMVVAKSTVMMRPGKSA
jgi:hypothetical protein